MNENFPILIAEENTDAVELLKRALREVGFNNPFHVSAHGQDVIHYLQGHGIYADRQKFLFPRILFLETHLPIIDGFRVLAWLQEHEHCNVIPRLVLSSSGSKDDITRVYGLGANTYLIKPPTYDGWSA